MGSIVSEVPPASWTYTKGPSAKMALPNENGSPCVLVTRVVREPGTPGRGSSTARGGRSVAKSSPRDWTLETDAGVMKVHFVEPNSFGVLDHRVTLAAGLTVTNRMRVISNGSGSELVMVLFQSPGISTEAFERDIQAVTDDLARLKTAAEAIGTENRQ